MEQPPRTQRDAGHGGRCRSNREEVARTFSTLMAETWLAARCIGVLEDPPERSRRAPPHVWRGRVFCSSIRPERRDFAESFATEVIPLRSGRHNLEKIGRRGWKPRAIKAKSKRRTRVSDPHVTSRGRGRPRHIFIMRSSSLLGSWVRAGRFPAPCAEAMARRVVLVEADRGGARGFDKV